MTRERVELFNRLGAARRLGDAAGLAAARRALADAGFASELESHGISIDAIAAPAVRASTHFPNRHPQSVEDTMTTVERAELEHLRAFARARAEDPKKKSTLDEIKALLREAIADPEEDPADREKARRLLRAIEDDVGLDEGQKKALARAMPMHDPFAMSDRQVLALRGLRS